MKIFFLPFFLAIMVFTGNAQVFRAGDMLSGYIDINPDTLINHNWPYDSPIESYFFDINQDMQNDFQLSASSIYTPGIQGYDIRIYPLNSQSFVVYGYTDSVYNTYLETWKVIHGPKFFYYGDTINFPDANWYNFRLFLMYYELYYATSINVTDWVDTLDEYLGIKYQSNYDTIYGWIRVNCPNPQKCFIKDYSFGTLTGIENFSSDNQFKIYPNPNNGNFFLKISDELLSNNNYQISLINLLGQVVYKSVVMNHSSGPGKNQVTQIDLRKEPKGIYFAQMINGNKDTFYKKILIE